MSTEIQKTKVIAAFVTVLLVTAAIYLAMEMKTNTQLEEKLNSEKLKSESMLSEKLALEKEINKFKSDLRSLQGKNEDLDKILDATNKKLEGKDLEYRKLQKQNASLFQVRKQYQELLQLKDELEQQLTQYNASLKQLKSANEDLTKTVALLQQKNDALKLELNSARLLAFNDVKIESIKKNNKLTVNARRTRKFLLNIDVPSGSDDLKFTIKDPSGRELTSKDGSMTSRVVSNSSNPSYVASLNGFYPDEAAYKKVEMVYTPAHKLSAGIYKIEIADKNGSIGSLQVRLK